MLSALDDINSIVDCINLGAADFITKPIDKVLLQARINNCLERKEYRDNEKKYLNKIKEEEKKNNDLLLNIMPASIAERLKSGESNIADRFSDVSVLFADISGFTEYSSNISPKVIVKKLNTIFSVFDDLVDKYSMAIFYMLVMMNGLENDGSKEVKSFLTLHKYNILSLHDKTDNPSAILKMLNETLKKQGIEEIDF